MNEKTTLEDKLKPRITEILPNTKRTQELYAKKQAEERKKQAEREQEMKAKQEKEMQIHKMYEERKKKMQQEEQKKKEEERKKAEERQQISTLKGKFGNMINDLQQNSTTLDFTISGLDLRPAQIRILVKAVEQNFSLKGLNMCRKNIKDSEGIEIANNLKKNFVLERLELEGNMLGPKSCTSIADLLHENNTIRVVDLEGNDLTNGGKDLSGIEALSQVLKKNDTLLCLNLSNTNLDKACSQMLLEMLEKNDTIISLDIDQNPNMNLEDVRKIQEKLKKNKQDYDNQRLEEFLERKKMSIEENISQIIHQNQESKKMAQENINVRIEQSRQDKETKWREFLEVTNTKNKKIYDKIAKEVFLGGGKKKKKKKKKK